MKLEKEIRRNRPVGGSELAHQRLTGSLREERVMQTVYPRYTLAERVVLAVGAIVTWPVVRFLGWVRRKVVVDLAPSADRT